MNFRLANGLAAAALGMLLSYPAVAEPARMRMVQAVGADVLPPYEIVTMVRSLGLNPVGRITRQGPYYVLHAVNPRGVEVRVVADAQFGDILSVAPLRAPVNYTAPRYDSGPRIVTVPQDYDRAFPDDDDELLPAPRQRVPRARAQPPQSPQPPQGYDRGATAPPPPAPRRAVLSPPAYRSDGPSPIKPLPRRREIDKFMPPQPEPHPQMDASEIAPEAAASAPPPTPESVLPPTPMPESVPPPADPPPASPPNQYSPVAPLE